MYSDNKPCRTCGAEVRLEARNLSAPRDDHEPDGPVDERVCTNPECPSHTRATDEGV